MDAVAAGIIGTVVGALIGFGGTWLSSWQQAKVAARERRADAYTQALIALQRERLIILRSWPIIGPGPEPPPPLNDDAAGLAEALLGAHSSSAIRRLLDDWVRLRGRFWALGWELEDAKQERARLGGDAEVRGRATIWRELEQARSDLVGRATPGKAILGAIEAQVRKELGYKD